MSESKLHFETLALHAGHTPDPCSRARAVPLHRSSSFVFRDTEHAANLFSLKEAGDIYSRISNPTLTALEERLAALEGGASAVAHASGTAAIFNTLVTLCQQGDEIVSAANLYGGTYSMFKSILPRLGITARLVDAREPEQFRRALTPHTRALFVETVSNPGLDVPDLEAIAAVAQQAHVPLIVDSTVTTPYLLRPLEHGASLVIHSLTKWLGGHGTGIGGVVIDGANFDWTDKKFVLFNEPDDSYHGLRWAHDLGDNQSLAFSLRLRLVPLRNLGACLAPDNAWLFLQGMETLALRMDRHCANAQAVAEHLLRHPRVAWVRYPGLAQDAAHPVAARYLKKGFGGLVVFGILGGPDAGAAFIEHLELFSHLANIGDAKSLAIHPASTTHSQLDENDLRAAGITPDMIRLSVGIENIQDILEDLDRALATAG